MWTPLAQRGGPRGEPLYREPVPYEDSRPLPRPTSGRRSPDNLPLKVRNADVEDSDDDEDLRKALEASQAEFEAEQRHKRHFDSVLELSAKEAALAEETANLELERAGVESALLEEQRRDQERQHQLEMDRAVQASFASARDSQSITDEEQQMLEMALALSRQIAHRDGERRRGWSGLSDSGSDSGPVAGPSGAQPPSPMEEGPLRVFGPTGISLLWKDGSSAVPAPREPGAPLTRPAVLNDARPLPSAPANAVAGPSRLPSMPRAPSMHRTSPPIGPGNFVPGRSAPSPPLPAPEPVLSARPLYRPSKPVRQSTMPTFGEHLPTIPTLGRHPTTISSLANRPGSAPPMQPSIMVTAPSIASNDGHEREVEDQVDDPFDDEHEDSPSHDYSPTIWSQDSATIWSGDSPMTSPTDERDAWTDDEASDITEPAPLPRVFQRTPRPGEVVQYLQNRAQSSAQYAPPSPSRSRQASARNSAAPARQESRRVEYPARTQHTPSTRARRTEREGRVQAGGIIPAEIGSPQLDIEDVARYGFLGRRLVRGEGLPDVIQLSNAAGDGKYSIFLVETPTWRTLLRLLMWYGSTRLEASPRDFVDRKSEAPFQVSIVLDFFSTAVCLSLRLMPSARARAKLFSASKRTVVIPTSPINVPTTLAQLATQLNSALQMARTVHHGPLHRMDDEVDQLSRIAGEPVSAVEEQRGMLERLKTRVLRQEKRRPTLPSGEEPLEESALMITPFRINGDAFDQ